MLLWGPYHFMKVFIKFPLPNSAQVATELSLLPSHLAQLDLEPPTQQIVREWGPAFKRSLTQLSQSLYRKDSLPQMFSSREGLDI